jgi:hypothetical protein
MVFQGLSKKELPSLFGEYFISGTRTVQGKQGQQKRCDVASVATPNMHTHTTTGPYTPGRTAITKHYLYTSGRTAVTSTPTGALLQNQKTTGDRWVAAWRADRCRNAACMSATVAAYMPIM